VVVYSAGDSEPCQVSGDALDTVAQNGAEVVAVRHSAIHAVHVNQVTLAHNTFCV